MNQIVPDRVGIVDADAEKTQTGASLPRHAQKRRRLHPKMRKGGARLGTPDATGHCLLAGALRPLHDRVLVQRDPAPAQTPGGIVIPEVGKTQALKGTVVAVGPGKKDSDGVFRETMVKPGDVVLFTASVDVPFADLVHDGDMVMMSEADILGVITEQLPLLRHGAASCKTNRR